MVVAMVMLGAFTVVMIVAFVSIVGFASTCCQYHGNSGNYK
jgi:hypothetical protein